MSRPRARRDLLKKSLFEWYAEEEPPGGTRWAIVWEMNAQLRPVSLRLLDWLVTNYAKEHKVYYMNTSETGGSKVGDPFDVHTSYRSWLKACRKTNFDPFRRGKRFYFDGKRERPDWAERCASLKRTRYELQQRLDSLRKTEDDKATAEELEKRLTEVNTEIASLKIMRTTVGQLNFFRWAISRGVFEWASTHRTEIEADMARKSASHRRSNAAYSDEDEEEDTRKRKISVEEEEEEAAAPIRLGEPATAERVQRLMKAIAPAEGTPAKRRKLSYLSSPTKTEQPSSCIVFSVDTSVRFLNHHATKPF